jgi:hypothetical protein
VADRGGDRRRAGSSRRVPRLSGRRLTRPGRRLTLVGAIALIGLAGAAGADAAPAPTQPRPLAGFLSEPTEQLAVPGDPASGEITPAGDIYTGWAEYQLFAGPRLTSWDQPTRVAPDPGEPLYQAQRRAGPVRYVEQAFTIDVAGRPVVYLTLQAINLTGDPHAARAALQLQYTRGRRLPTVDGVAASPYRFPRPVPNTLGNGQLIQLGEPFDPGWVYAVTGRDVTRDGELLARGPAAPATPLPTGGGDAPTSPHAKLAYRATLPAHGQTSWTWQIPLAPPTAAPSADAALDAIELPRARRALSALWRRQTRGAMTIRVPERRIGDLYRESLVNILAARILTPAGWEQAVNRFQYQAYWLRDSAIMTVALDQADLSVPAAENLGYLPRWQQPSGAYISQPDQLDGVGEALWEIGEHGVLTDDAAYAASQLRAAGAAVNWIAATTQADADGLLPPATIDDDEFLTGARITGDDIWAAVGLRSAIALARVADDGQLIAAWTAIDRRFEAHLDAALAADQTAHGHITPGLDAPGGRDWGNYQLDYPMAIVGAHSREVTDTIGWERSHSEQGLADYHRPGFLHDYLAFPIFQSELNRGGPGVARAIAGLYAEAIHTTATGAGWEDGPIGYTLRSSRENLAPHGTFAGQYVSLIHNLLINDTGRGVDLLAGVAPAWMAPGDHVRVGRAVTSAGIVSLALRARRTGATLHWSLARHADDHESLSWVLPYWVRSARLPDGRSVHGAVRLPAGRGSLTLRWSATRPRQSLAAAIAALDRAYRRHHRAAPLVPARDW